MFLIHDILLVHSITVKNVHNVNKMKENYELDSIFFSLSVSLSPSIFLSVSHSLSLMETHCDDGNTLRERENITRKGNKKMLQENVTTKVYKKMWQEKVT